MKAEIYGTPPPPTKCLLALPLALYAASSLAHQSNERAFLCKLRD